MSEEMATNAEGLAELRQAVENDLERVRSLEAQVRQAFDGAGLHLRTDPARLEIDAVRAALENAGELQATLARLERARDELRELEEAQAREEARAQEEAQARAEAQARPEAQACPEAPVEPAPGGAARFQVAILESALNAAGTLAARLEVLDKLETLGRELEDAELLESFQSRREQAVAAEVDGLLALSRQRKTKSAKARAAEQARERFQELQERLRPETREELSARVGARLDELGVGR